MDADVPVGAPIDFTSLSAARDLQMKVDALCPNAGSFVGDVADKSTWGFHPKPEATQAQIDAATAVIASMVISAYQPGGGVYDAEKAQLDRYAEYPNVRDQLNAIWAALEAIGKTIVLPKEAVDMIAARKAVQDKYPFSQPKG